MSRVAVAALAGAVIVAAGATALAGRPADAPALNAPTVEVVPVTRATLACPETETGTKTQTRLLAVTPVTDDAVASGTLRLSALAEDPQVIAEVTVPGEAIRRPLGNDAVPAALVLADQGQAAGTTAAQWTTEDGKDRSGLAASWCSAGADTWLFPGVTTAVGARTRLVLTNPTPAISIVDLRFYGPDGEVNAVGRRGIALAAWSRQSFDLARFAPGLDALTVGVEASTGRVTAGIHVALTEGVTPVGTEWLPAAAPPADEVVVNADVAGGAGQSLQITNPGDREALVGVRVIDSSGSFVPSGLDNLRVAPGSVLVEDLSSIVDNDAASVKLTSTVPVTGALLSTTSKPADLTVSAPSAPLGDPAAVPLIPETDLTLAFTSGGRVGGQVMIEGFAASGEPVLSRTLNLRGLTTTTWQPKQGTRAAYLVVTVTVDADMQAVAQYEGVDGVTALAVLSGRYTVTRPDVGRVN